jgi:hypothetical protein
METLVGILCACLPFLLFFFKSSQGIADPQFSTGQRSRPNNCLRQLVPGHQSLEMPEDRGQETYTARAWAEAQRVDKAKKVDENGVVVTTVFEVKQ